MPTKTNLKMYRDSKGRFTKRSREVEDPDMKLCDNPNCFLCGNAKNDESAIELLDEIVESGFMTKVLSWQNDDLRDDLAVARGRNALWFMLGLLTGITIASVAVIIGMGA